MKLKHTKVATLAATLIAYGSFAGGVNAALLLTFTEELNGDITMTSSGSVQVGTFTGEGAVPILGEAFGGGGVRTSLTGGFLDSYAGTSLIAGSWVSPNVFPSAVTTGQEFQINGNSLSLAANSSDGVSSFTTLSGTSIVYNSINFIGAGLDGYARDTDIGFWQSSVAGDDGRINFRLETASVPEPSSAMLIGLSALGMVARRKRTN